jgi:GWxTD domain-containing protein
MLRSLCLVVLGIVIGGPAVTAATPKTVLPARYNRWIKEEVVYIITDEEKKEFLKLTTDAERDKFIDDFWAVRNPVRGSEVNSYKEEHYRRLQYARDNFGRRSNTPGWMTDMGRAWILFGKPVSRAPFLGYGQLYPCELWFYENKASGPSLPGYFTLLFFMPEDIGEYRFYRPSLDTPMKLVRGSQFNSNKDVYNFLKPIAGDLAKAAFTLIPGDPMDTQNFTVDMTSDMLVSRIQNFANDPFNVRRIRELRSLREKVNSYFTVDQGRPLGISSLVLADPDGKFWLDYAVAIDDPRLGQRDGTNLKVSLGYRLTTAAGQTVLEDSQDGAWTAYADGSADTRLAPFAIAGRLPIEPGAYKLMIDITNRQAQQTYRGEADVTAGAVKGPAFSDPLVTSSVERVARPDPYTPFQYFGVQFHPSVRHEINHPDPLRLLFELHEPAGSTADYQLEYMVASPQDKDARRSITDEVKQAEFKDSRLMKSKTIAINDLENGDYRLIVNLRQAGSREVLASSNTPLRISPDKAELPLYFLADTQGMSRPGVIPYMRALEAISQKNDTAAAGYFSDALNRNPGNVFAGQSLIQLYFNQRKYTPIADLYKRIGIDAFKGSPVTLAQIALSLRENGDAEQARSVLSVGLGLFPGNATLSGLQSRSR